MELNLSVEIIEPRQALLPISAKGISDASYVAAPWAASGKLPETKSFDQVPTDKNDNKIKQNSFNLH